jgi:hypothetical protein
MKVSKALLKTIAAGLVVVGGLQSCIEDINYDDHQHDESCTLNCDLEERSSDDDIWDCPPCGMG